MGTAKTVVNNDSKQKNCQIFGEIGIRMELDSFEACHRLENKDRTIVKFLSMHVKKKQKNYRASTVQT